MVFGGFSSSNSVEKKKINNWYLLQDVCHKLCIVRWCVVYGAAGGAAGGLGAVMGPCVHGSPVVIGM